MSPDLDDILIEDEDGNEAPEIIVVAKKINYLNNKDMLKEIHRSKNSFCEYIDPKYSDYDVIVENISEIFLSEIQDKARVTRAARIASIAYEAALLSNISISKADKPKLSEFKIKPDSISIDDLVFRVLGFDHIPLAPGRKRNPKSEADNYIKLNFYPFKHFVIENGSAKEVGRSHSKNGKFNIERGSITNKLAKMFILMVNKYAQRGNWRGYTYLDEMKGQALLQLAQMGLQFDEYKSDNPFSYYTASVSNSFTRVLNLEKKNQDLRDDLLVESGASPSFSRQLAVEEEIRRLREDAQDAAKDEH
ncbi:MAG TPA: hypothetical protein VIY47_02135 [Ignavibacteriaceae bacterium]